MLKAISAKEKTENQSSRWLKAAMHETYHLQRWANGTCQAIDSRENQARGKVLALLTRRIKQGQGDDQEEEERERERVWLVREGRRC